MLQTDQRFPGLDNNQEALKQNADSSYDIYFSPKPPEGMENNWIQTVPGKGWSTSSASTDRWSRSTTSLGNQGILNWSSKSACDQRGP